jgi:hypothetical protein
MQKKNEEMRREREREREQQCLREGEVFFSTKRITRWDASSDMPRTH